MDSLSLTRSDLHRQKAYIDGAWVEGSTRIAVLNPATHEQIGTIPNLGALETETAVAAAERAQVAWKCELAKERGRILRRWSQLMLDNAGDLAAILTQEQGKPLSEAKGEVAYAASFLEWFAEEARRIDGEILAPHQADKRLYVHKVPVGVVAAITPWNFPLAMITRKAGPALAAGCTMVLKPSELTPYSALALAVLAEEAGVPNGVFNVVTGDAAPIGDVLTDDTRVRKFTFTGSTAVGKMLAARCMDTVKRVSLELGGNAPFIIFDDADLDKAVEGALIAKFRNTGQTCVCANRFYVQSGIYEKFAAALAGKVKAMRFGPGIPIGEADCGPLIDTKAVEKVGAHVSDCVARGGQLLVGGRALEGAPGFFEPTVISEVSANSMLCREETFGPVAGLVRFEDEDEAIALANCSRAGLASYFFTRDYGRVHRVSEALDYGMVGVNTGIISTEVAPFGGVKESGLGREGSRHGIEDYLEIKMVCAAI
ncbi:MAG: NAD-dependent succinate-semialdehyde dehydrogenase [Sphingomonadaceae bacterium]|jgi:succinate-semialdehyde dehydrogenase/glutarate-semialdehyde dehydrogenase|uniref:NAD-dependent succinate-semialdehyde dehydrogenase n=1 Tax=Sphingorhabdus sp. TaxID=1902408 RepID=UPI0039BD2B87|nr:NAD-dependent succinate-semialdehyde dehydrogenase [Sphingomonadaceae bacterium]